MGPHCSIPGSCAINLGIWATLLLERVHHATGPRASNCRSVPGTCFKHADEGRASSDDERAVGRRCPRMDWQRRLDRRQHAVAKVLSVRSTSAPTHPRLRNDLSSTNHIGPWCRRGKPVPVSNASVMHLPADRLAAEEVQNAVEENHCPWICAGRKITRSVRIEPLPVFCAPGLPIPSGRQLF